MSKRLEYQLARASEFSARRLHVQALLEHQPAAEQDRLYNIGMAVDRLLKSTESKGGMSWA
jgi:hypothetical protein